MDALSVDSLDSLEELKETYKRRMREVHPDVNHETDTTEEAMRVNRAYTILSEVRLT
jgi:DnaJ-class molecular chaperone